MSTPKKVLIGATRNLVHAMYLVIPVEIRVVMVGVRKAIGTLDLGVGMRTRILTGVLGVMSLEIKIPTWTRKAIGTLETVETWLPIQKVAIGILDLVIPMKILTGETMAITNHLGVLEMKTRIPTGVLGVMVLKIKSPIRARKAIGTLGTVITRLLIQTIAIGTLTNPLGVLEMKTGILTGVLGILEIKILTGARKVIGILDLVMQIKTPLGEAIAAGAQQMPQAMLV